MEISSIASIESMKEIKNEIELAKTIHQSLVLSKEALDRKIKKLKECTEFKGKLEIEKANSEAAVEEKIDNAQMEIEKLK